MDFLPSFPMTVNPLNLPSIPHTSPKTSTSAPVTIQKSPIYTLNQCKLYFEKNKEENSGINDDSGSVAFLEEGPSVEITLENQKKNYAIKKSKISTESGCVKLTIPKWTLHIYQSDEKILNTVLAAYHIVKHSQKTKYPRSVSEITQDKINAKDKFEIKVFKWKFDKSPKMTEIEADTAYNQENIPEVYKPLVYGFSYPNKVVKIENDEITLVDIISYEKFVRRISVVNVADRLAQLEDNADILIARAENYVKYKQMQRALNKLKEKSYSLDKRINANAIELLNLQNAAAEGQENISDIKMKILRAPTDQKEEEALICKERASMISTINGINTHGDDLELEMLSQDGSRMKFADYVLSAFKVLCADLGSGNDFSADALKQKLSAATALIMESSLI
ncbi:hypothetical protein TVAG_166440 [Trichomonas vaginalis G3]|uniref:Uncharacterized protein n=1 Tax=Trichomonas vaginalis (strain ATCC PRA-98 / G3) TaxID=412133 RepID=A2DE51_TRIV3|nr:hypothetical protein TVAGG3_0174520 [Trichomonas vaginalis G3]EAY21269.1 hypothetical protein TVAG_166440 [Trichomonas vaginalis G3]KAI5548843.1 hypothetical protein TVAGG3_0174520 [Trichomonas vaginalis G3]|eukprot:XP_001582255.1 hypothetical protein [Trichomonas vaginalis G3]